eukprot:3415425-Amphidinium_carterae.3
MTEHGGYRDCAASHEDLGVALPLVPGCVSLPQVAAEVDLLSETILPSRLSGCLMQPERMMKTEDQLEGPRPRMHLDVEGWSQQADELWKCGMIRWINAKDIPTVRGIAKRAGLYVVSTEVIGVASAHDCGQTTRKLGRA